MRRTEDVGIVVEDGDKVGNIKVSSSDSLGGPGATRGVVDVNIGRIRRVGV